MVGFVGPICKGRLEKTSGRSYSQVRPIARHFVWLEKCTQLAICKSLKMHCDDPTARVGIAAVWKELLGWEFPKSGGDYRRSLATPEGVEPPTLRSEV